MVNMQLEGVTIILIFFDDPAEGQWGDRTATDLEPRGS